MFKLVPGNAQDIGSQRNQQDAFAFSDQEDEAFVAHGGVLAIVADGMGELKAGKSASRAAVATFLAGYSRKTSRETIQASLRRCIDEANAATLIEARETGDAGKAGATLAAAVIHDASLYWVCIGDIRLYLLRAGQLIQVNAGLRYGKLDWSSVISGAVLPGQVTSRLSADNLQVDRVASYLGQPALTGVDASVRGYPLREEDVILLCTEGVYRSLSEGEIAAAFLRADPDEACETIRDCVLAKGRAHQDNLTAIAIRCDAEASQIEMQRQIPALVMAEERKTLRQPNRILMGVLCFAVLVASWLAASAVSDCWLARTAPTAGHVQPVVVQSPALPHPLRPKPSAAKRAPQTSESVSPAVPSAPIQFLNDND